MNDIIRDNGLVVYDIDAKTFYTAGGITGWDRQLRKARIYQSGKYVREILNRYPKKNLVIKHVTITASDMI